MATGVNPGFVLDALPIMLTAVCQRVDHVLVRPQNPLTVEGAVTDVAADGRSLSVLGVRVELDAHTAFSGRGAAGWRGGETNRDGIMICPPHHARAHDSRYDFKQLPSGKYGFHRRT